jgi:hypothetical protein
MGDPGLGDTETTGELAGGEPSSLTDATELGG